MKTFKTVSILLLFAVQLPAAAQFNTVTRVKVLPRIQVDSSITERKADYPALAVKPEDSTRFQLVKNQPGAVVSMPLSHPVITSKFGNRIDPLTGEEKLHQGIDLKGSADLVMAIMPGEVTKVAYSRGLGNYIEVEHGDFKSIYGHLSFVMVPAKTKVKAGQVIGVTGSTGRSTSDHLHFTIKHMGRIINPIPFLDLIYTTLTAHAQKEIVKASR